jgi:hypothetical protein
MINMMIKCNYLENKFKQKRFYGIRIKFEYGFPQGQVIFKDNRIGVLLDKKI